MVISMFRISCLYFHDFVRQNLVVVYCTVIPFFVVAAVSHEN